MLGHTLKLCAAIVYRLAQHSANLRRAPVKIPRYITETHATFPKSTEDHLNRLNIVWVLMVAWMAAGCSSSSAYAGSEDITYGSWSGTFTPTGAETINISYLVKRENAR